MISSAYASTEYLKSHANSCFQCGKQTKRIQCQYCFNVFFCSKKCASNRVHRKNCNKMFNQSDCGTVRLVTEIINTASNAISDMNIFFEFCAGIFNKKTKDCQPPYSQYGEILQLKGKAEQQHVSIAKRAVKCVKCLPQFSSISTADHDRILFYLAYQHTTTIAMNSFSENIELTEGGILKRFSIHDILSRINHSCAPNLHHCIDDKDVIHCIVVRPIKKRRTTLHKLFGREEIRQ